MPVWISNLHRRAVAGLMSLWLERCQVPSVERIVSHACKLQDVLTFSGDMVQGPASKIPDVPMQRPQAPVPSVALCFCSGVSRVLGSVHGCSQDCQPNWIVSCLPMSAGTRLTEIRLVRPHC